MNTTLTKLEKFVLRHPDMDFNEMANQLNRTVGACDRACDRAHKKLKALGIYDNHEAVAALLREPNSQLKQLLYFYIVEKGTEQRVLVADPYPSRKAAEQVMQQLEGTNCLPMNECVVRAYSHRR